MGHLIWLNSKWLQFDSEFSSIYLNTIWGVLLYLILTVRQRNLNWMRLHVHKTESLIKQTVFLAPAIPVKCMENYKSMPKPCYRQHTCILPVPWSFVISRFHYRCLKFKLLWETTRMTVFITGPVNIWWNNKSIKLSWPFNHLLYIHTFQCLIWFGDSLCRSHLVPHHDLEQP